MRSIKQNAFLAFSLTLTACCFAGCSSAPKHHNLEYTGNVDNTIYTVTATSSDEVRASDLAMERAISICKPKDREVLLVEHSSKYQGMTKPQKDLVHLANQDLKLSASSVSAFDYRGILKFKCIEKAEIEK